MNEKSRRTKLPLKNRILVWSILLTVTGMLLYFLPRESKFNYLYEQDRPWRYTQLIASYDFPIFKSDAEIKAEQDSLLRTFRPYYRLDTTYSEQRIQALKTDFAKGKFEGVPAYYLPRLEQLLREVYDIGVMNTTDKGVLSTLTQQSILLLRGHVATTRQMETLLTPASAYEHIISKDQKSVGREMLERCHLRNYLVPNVVYDSVRTHAERAELMNVSPTCGMVQSGQLIIDRGQIVTAEHKKILDSMKKESLRRTDPSEGHWLQLLGQTVFLMAVIGLFYFYLWLYRRDYLLSPHSILLLFSLIALFPMLTYFMVGRNLLSIYLVPYAIIPIFIRIFLDSRTAFLATVISSLLSSLALYGPYEFLLYQTVTGMAAIYTLRELTERSQLLKTTAAVTLSGIIVLTAYEYSQGIDLADLDTSRCIYIAIGGVLLLFAYPLMYLFEKVFGFTSSVTLVELTNINHPILRRMSKVAQGTFNHSMQVANLAAEVADKIGAKPQLVRTGALYHDIGKMVNPAFFTENQSGVNPHNSLSEERSAEIIISHVTEGMRLAEKYHLPEVIRQFITTHHGAGLAKYFYIQYANKHPEEEVDENLFRYPGPNPFTREHAILMMCDSVEAASRSLKEYTEESISALVNKIIDGQLAEGYFRECPLTFKDIAEAKRVLTDSLKTIYHTRISYPERNTPAPSQEQARQGIFTPWKK